MNTIVAGRNRAGNASFKVHPSSISRKVFQMIYFLIRHLFSWNNKNILPANQLVVANQLGYPPQPVLFLHTGRCRREKRANRRLLKWSSKWGEKKKKNPRGGGETRIRRKHLTIHKCHFLHEFDRSWTFETISCLRVNSRDYLLLNVSCHLSLFQFFFYVKKMFPIWWSHWPKVFCLYVCVSCPKWWT